jgi:hypothetical protein
MLKAISTGLSSGGTIDGDLVVSGDLTVNGGGSLSFDEIIEGTQVIDVDSTEALLVRANGDGGDVFTVDTANGDMKLKATGKLYLDGGGGGTYIYESSDGVIDFHGNTTHLVSMKQNGTQSEVVINEGSGDVDFRVESNGDTHAFFIQSSDGKIGIGEQSPTGFLHISPPSGSSPTMYFEQYTSATDGTLGEISFGNRAVDGQLATISAVNDGANDSAYLAFSTEVTSGALSERMRISSDGSIGLGTGSPSSLVEIQGGLTTTGAVLTLSTKETTVVANDVLGKIDFKAPLEASGTDAILTGASIHAVATDTFAADNNKTDLIISTGASEAATEKVRIDSAGNIGMNITPSSWHASWRGIQLGNGGSGIGGGYTPYSNVALTQNAYLDGSGTWRRVVGDHCGTITSYDGTWYFHVGGTGSADSSCGFDTPLTINNNNKITIDQNYNQTALEIDAENTDAVGVDMVFGSMTSGYGVRIRSGSADAALTTGTLLDVYSKDSDNSSRNLMRIVNDEGNATGTNCLKIHNDAASTDLFLDHNGGDGASIYIDSETVSDSIIYFADPVLTEGFGIRMANMDSLTTGGAILIESDSSSTGSRSLLKIINDNTSATGTTVINIQQDSTGPAIVMNAAVGDRSSAPTLGFGDGDTGLFESADDVLKTSIAGTVRMVLDASSRISLSNNDNSNTGNTIFGASAFNCGADNGSDYNVVIGQTAMGTGAVSAASHNVAIGADTIADSTSATGNVAIGSSAMYNSVSPDNCVAIGRQAIGVGNNTQEGTVSIGYQSLKELTSGAGNVAVGYQAGLEIDTQANCTLVGYQAGMDITHDNASNTTCIGYKAGTDITEGKQNIAIGSNALLDCTTADYCVAVGNNALENVSTGANNKNTAVGFQAGITLTTGIENILLGAQADVDTNSRQGCIVIGTGLSLNTANDNVVEIGNNTNSMTYDLDGGDITVTSDLRTKKNIKDTKLGLEFINKLRPITYQTKSTSQYPKEFGIENPSKKSSGKTWDGLIAQEVKEVMDEMSVGFSGWEEGINTKQRLAYGKFIMPLIKAVQELSARIEALENK